MAEKTGQRRRIWHHWRRVLFVAATVVIAALAIVASLLFASFYMAPAGHTLGFVPVEVPVISTKRLAGRVLFAGDTYFGESYRRAAGTLLRRQGYRYPFRNLEALLASADLTIANLETPLTVRTVSPHAGTKSIIHRGVPDQTTTTLAHFGVQAVSLANNHAMDYGAPGLEDTLAALGAHNLLAFGGGPTIERAARPHRHDIVVGQRPFRLAIIGVFARDSFHWWNDFYAGADSAGSYGLWATTIVEQLKALKTADPGLYLVVFPHWGTNYAWRTAEQQRYGRAMIDAGADLVVGHGAHLVQELERYRDRWIIYSLGNFVFLSAGRYRSLNAHPHSAILSLDLTPKPTGLDIALRLYLVASNNRETRYRPRILTGQTFEQAVALLRERSDPGDLRTGRDPIGPYIVLQVR